MNNIAVLYLYRIIWDNCTSQHFDLEYIQMG